MTLTPAYGRDYKTKADALRDLMGNMDFVSQPGGRYINLEQLPWTAVSVRYDRLRKQFMFRRPKWTSTL